MIRSILKSNLVRWAAGPPLNLISKGCVRVKSLFEFWSLPEFKSLGDEVVFRMPRAIARPECISIGSNVYLGPNSVLCCAKSLAENQNPQLIISSGVWATLGLQIYCISSVIIEEDVMIAGNVFVSDYSHGYSDATTPYISQGFSEIRPVKISKGCWIGQNVVVLPGVHIGEGAIVGANSVVTKSIPPRSIAVGAPARVIRTWDDDRKGWR
ncbi:MAG TPA: acyltransferase [Chthoniobacterales bacterium]|jgi:acetyltransferase-like isoleucine patch superfamily enzyme